MSVAERTRAAVAREPFLYDALRAGIVNYSAAARYLEVDGDEESIATALRRFAAELDAEAPGERRASVRLRRGVDVLSTNETTETATSDNDDPLLAVGTTSMVDSGDLAAVYANGDVDATALEAILGRLRAADVEVAAAAVAADDLLIAVGRRSGPEALRIVESVLE